MRGIKSLVQFQPASVSTKNAPDNISDNSPTRNALFFRDTQSQETRRARHPEYSTIKCVACKLLPKASRAAWSARTQTGGQYGGFGGRWADRRNHCHLLFHSSIYLLSGCVWAPEPDQLESPTHLGGHRKSGAARRAPLLFTLMMNQAPNLAKAFSFAAIPPAPAADAPHASRRRRWPIRAGPAEQMAHAAGRNGTTVPGSGW
jgi:hypothetical protein